MSQFSFRFVDDREKNKKQNLGVAPFASPAQVAKNIERLAQQNTTTTSATESGQSATPETTKVNTNLVGAPYRQDLYLGDVANQTVAGQTPSEPKQEYKVNEKSAWANAATSFLNGDELGLQTQFNRMYDPKDPLYMPYITATNVDALTAFGMSVGKDYSNGMSAEDYDQWSDYYYGLVQEGKVKVNPSSGGLTFTSPNTVYSTNKAKTNNKEGYALQQQAYLFNQVVSRETYTREAEKELAQLQEEIRYLVGRTDLNLSDKDIKDHIDLSKYKKLGEMAETAKAGGRESLNRSVAYSDQLLEGLIWEARNEGSELVTGNAAYDSVISAAGLGNQWKYDENINPYLDSRSDTYNPFKVTGTMDDMFRKYGVTSFTRESYEALDSKMKADPSVDYQEWALTDGKKIKTALAYTEECNKQAELARRYIDECLEYGDEIDWEHPNSDNYIFKKHALMDGSEYDPTSTLKKLQEGINFESKMPETTGPINYDLNELKRYYNRRKNEMSEEYAGFDDRYAELFGTAEGFSQDDIVDQAMEKAIKKYKDVLLEYGSLDDQDLMEKLGTLTDPDKVATFVGEYVDAGLLPKDDAVQLMYRSVEQYTAKHFMPSLWNVSEYENGKAAVDEGKKGLEALGLTYDASRKGPGVYYETTQSLLTDLLNDTFDYDGAIENGSYTPLPNPMFPALNQKGTWEDQMVFLAKSYEEADAATKEEIDGALRATIGQMGGPLGPDGYTGIMDALKWYDKERQVNSLYAKIINGEAKMEDYEAYYDDSKKAIDTIFQEFNDAQDYAIGVYGAPFVDAQDKSLGNYSAHMLSWGYERFYHMTNAMQYVLQYGGQDYIAQAPAVATRYSLIAENSTPEVRQEMAEARGITVDEYTDAMAKEDALDYLLRKKEKYDEQLKLIEEAEQAIDTYGLNVSEIGAMVGEKNMPYESFQKYAQDVRDAAAYFDNVELQWNADFDETVAKYLEENYLSGNSIGPGNNPFYALFDDNGKLIPGFEHLGEKERASFIGAADAKYIDSMNAVDFVGMFATGASSPNAASKPTGGRFSAGDAMVYFYMLAKGQTEEAAEFRKYVETSGYGTMRNAQVEMSEYRQFANEYPVLASAATIATSPLQVGGTVYAVAQGIRGEEIDPNAEPFWATRFSTTTRSQIGENIEKEYGSGWRFLYDTTMSGGDSLVNGMITGGIMGGLGLTAGFLGGHASTATFRAAGKLLGNFTSASLMGMEAAGTSIWNARMNNIDSGTALLLGGATFLCETLTETITVENIHSIFSNKVGVVEGLQQKFMDVLKDTLKSLGPEAASEILAEIGDIGLNQLLLGDDSEFNHMMQDYMNKGYTKDAAFAKAFKDCAHDVLLAGVGGALMAGEMGAVSMIRSGMRTAYGNIRYGHDAYTNMRLSSEGAIYEKNVKDLTAQMEKAKKAVEEKNTKHNQAALKYATKQLDNATRQYMDWQFQLIEMLDSRANSGADGIRQLQQDQEAAEAERHNRDQANARALEEAGMGAVRTVDTEAAAQPLTIESINSQLDEAEALASEDKLTNAQAEADARAEADRVAEESEKQAQKQRDDAVTKAENRANKTKGNAEARRAKEIAAANNLTGDAKDQAIAAANKKANATIKAANTMLQNATANMDRMLQTQLEYIANQRNASYDSAASARAEADAAVDRVLEETRSGLVNQREQIVAEQKAQQEIADARTRKANAIQAETDAKAEADRVAKEATAEAARQNLTDRDAIAAKRDEALNELEANTELSEEEKEGSRNYINALYDQQMEDLATAYQGTIDGIQGEKNAAYARAEEERGIAVEEADGVLTRNGAPLEIEPPTVQETVQETGEAGDATGAAGSTDAEAQAKQDLKDELARLKQEYEDGVKKASELYPGADEKKQRSEYLKYKKDAYERGKERADRRYQARLDAIRFGWEVPGTVTTSPSPAAPVNPAAAMSPVGPAGDTVAPSPVAVVREAEAQSADAMNGIQGAVERFQQTVDGFVNQVMLGGNQETISAAVTQLRQLAGENEGLINVIKAALQKEMDAVKTEPNAERLAQLNALDNVQEKMQAIVDFMGEIENTEGVAVPVSEAQPIESEAVPVPTGEGIGTMEAPVAEEAQRPTGTEEAAAPAPMDEVAPPTLEGETPSGADGLQELIDGFRQAASDAMDRIRGALTYVRDQSATQVQNDAETKARAEVLDMYNSIKDTIGRMRELYATWVTESKTAKRTKDPAAADAAKNTQATFGDLFKQLGDMWEKYVSSLNGLGLTFFNGDFTQAQTINGEEAGRESADPTATAIAVLNRAGASGNRGTQFAAVQAVMNRKAEYGVDNTTIARAGAATQAMFRQFGTQGTIQGLKHAFGQAYVNGIHTGDLRSAMTILALSGDQANATLRDLFTGKIGAADAIDITDTQFRNNSVAQAMLAKKVEAYQVGVELRRLIGQGGLDATEGSKANLEHANQQLEEAQRDLDTKITERENRYKELQDAMEEYDRALGMEERGGSAVGNAKTGKQSALDTASAAVATASQNYGNAMSVVAEYQQKVNNAQQAQRIAQKKYDDAVSGAMGKLRTQALANVRQANAENDARLAEEKAARDAQAAEAVANAEQNVRNAADAARAEAGRTMDEAERARAQAETDRENRNADRLDVDQFIEKFFPSATKEEKQHIRERANPILQEATDRDSVNARKRFVKRLEQKFGVKIRIVDSTAGGTRLRFNGKYDSRTNTIYLDRGATQKDAIYAVALHELTHALERTGNYGEYARILLEMEYGTSAEGRARLNADVRARQELYNARLARMHEQDPSVNATPLTLEDARKEIVADLTQKLLYGDQAAIERLISEDPKTARTVWQAIKDFLKKLVGIQDEAVTQIDRARQLFEEGLTAANAETSAALREHGIEIDAGSGAAVQYSIRTAPQTEAEIDEAVSRLVNSGRGFTEEESRAWVESLSTVSTAILQNMAALDYQNDPRYTWLKENSDYTQGSIDFNTNCPKRTQFTAIFDRLQKAMPDRVFTAKDYEAIRQKLIERGITVTCGPCFVEDRRQHTGEIAQSFIDQLNDGSLKPKFRSKIGKDTYVPSQYDLVTYEGLRRLYDEHRGIHDAFVAFNNARGMASARLVEGMAEYNNQIKKWDKRTITGKNNKGGLRIFSLSDADPRTMIDIIQIVLDASSKGLMIQGYTKKPWFARMIKDTGMRVLRSHIPKGNGIKNGQIWYDDLEGINRYDKNYKDENGVDVAESSQNIGDNIIGINDEMIRVAMRTREIDQIIPFHSSLANMIRNKKKIGDWVNYKLDQTDKDASTGKVAKKQINIYKDVINAWAAKGKPIKNKVEFVNAFLEVCKERNLTPRFDKFLNKENGEYVYTEGYEKFLVDYKLFDRDTGEIIPQVPVKAKFDDAYNRQVLEDYVNGVSEIVPAGEEDFQAVMDMFNSRDEQYSLPVSPETDADYMAAVEEGDMETAQRMVDRAADAAGYDTNYLVYRGDSGDYNELLTAEELGLEDEGGGNLGNGLYFTPNRSYAERFARNNPDGVLRKFYLKADAADLADQSVQRELREIVSEFSEEYGEPTNAEVFDELLSRLEKNAVIGHDVGGFSYGADEIAVQSSWQAKLADPLTYDDDGDVIPLSERFNPDSPDIRYSLPSDDVLDEQIRAWLGGELGDFGESRVDTLGGERAELGGEARTGMRPATDAAPITGAPKGAPKKSPFTIARDLAGKLGIGDWIATRKMNRVPKTVAGYYNIHARYVAVRPSEAGSYGITMHELGHALQDRLGIESTDAMVAALKADPCGLAVDNYSPAQQKKEAFAEFFWRYAESEQRGVDFAGLDFVEQFNEALREDGIYDDVYDAIEGIRAWVEADVGGRIDPMVHELSEKRKNPGLRERFRHTIASFTDKTSAAEKLNHELREQKGTRKLNVFEDVRSMALMTQSSAKVAYHNLTHALTDSRRNIIGKGLAERFEEVGLKNGNMKLWETYMLALHSVARDAQGKPVFDNELLTPEQRLAWIAEMDRQHPEFRKAADAFEAFRKEFMQAWLVDTGFLSQDAFDAMNDMYPYYVPTQRVEADKRSDEGRPNGSSQTYEIKRATGSTEDIWSPLDTFVSNVNRIVNMVSANNAALAWDSAYQSTGGLGVFGREVTSDMEKQTVDTKALQNKVRKLLKENVDGDLMDEVIKLIGEEQVQFRSKDGTILPNSISVQLPDGSKRFYQMQDMELYRLLSGYSAVSKDKDEILGKIATVTKIMSALTTGSNPVFALRNFLRDFQTSVNYGSWAANYFTGSVKWLMAFWDVWKNDSPLLKKFGVDPQSAYDDYLAMGGGGYSRIEADTKKGAREYRDALVSKGANTKNVGAFGRFAGKKLWAHTTFERLNEIVEQTSRYAEYKLGKHDTTTAEGRTEAYLAAQDVTVDFGRSGYGRAAKTMKAFVPFFNASMQGVYRTGRMFSEAERDRLPARFLKTVLNTGIMSALCAMALKAALDDDEKKEFTNMKYQLKAGHFYLPNIAPAVFGDVPLIRIPIGQDPLMVAVHGLTTMGMWSGNPDGTVLSLAAIAEGVVNNLNPIGSTIFDPIMGVMSNLTWYGSPITPTRYAGLGYEAQYSEDIPDIFVGMSHSLANVFHLNAFQIQYLVQQYTGFLGQMAIPALTKENGKIGGLGAALNAARQRMTSDPLKSSEATSAFYAARDFLDEVGKDYKAEKLGDVFKGMSEKDQEKCAKQAEGLTKGVVKTTYNYLVEANQKIDKITADENKTDHEKYIEIRDIRRKMNEKVLYANEKIGEFYDTWVRPKSLVNMLIFGDDYLDKYPILK